MNCCYKLEDEKFWINSMVPLVPVSVTSVKWMLRNQLKPKWAIHSFGHPRAPRKAKRYAFSPINLCLVLEEIYIYMFSKFSLCLWIGLGQWRWLIATRSQDGISFFLLSGLFMSLSLSSSCTDCLCLPPARITHVFVFAFLQPGLHMSLSLSSSCRNCLCLLPARVVFVFVFGWCWNIFFFQDCTIASVLIHNAPCHWFANVAKNKQWWNQNTSAMQAILNHKKKTI